MSNEITSAGHLNARSFSFSDEIIVDDNKLNFYVDCNFNVDEVFGTQVCTDKNDDYINVYADYDMDKQAVCDCLTILLWTGDGHCSEQSYALSDGEKEVFLRKMNAYCLVQNGLLLTDYASQYMAESATPMQEPTM